MSRQRAFVITLGIEDDLSDLEVASDLADLLADEGYEVASVNPFGGDAPTLGAGGVPRVPSGAIGIGIGGFGL